VTDPSLQPELSDVLQVEPEEDPRIEVCVRDVHGPVRTQELPFKAGAAFHRVIAATVVQPPLVLSADHYRGRATLICSGGSMRVSFNAPDESYAIWPAGVPLVIKAAVDTYVRPDSASDPITLSVIPERWATGE
jgi:hypothetical protein